MGFRPFVLLLNCRPIITHLSSLFDNKIAKFLHIAGIHTISKGYERKKNDLHGSTSEEDFVILQKVRGHEARSISFK